MKGKGGRQEETELTREQTINYLLDLAKQTQEQIVNKDFESTTQLLADKLKEFSQVLFLLIPKQQQHMDFVELIDVYFVLADAYIEKKQLKRAERYLSTGYTVFFKIQEETLKAHKGVLDENATRNLNALRATLCKMIGKLKRAKGEYDNAIKQFAHSVRFSMSGRYILIVLSMVQRIIS